MVSSNVKDAKTSQWNEVGEGFSERIVPSRAVLFPNQTVMADHTVGTGV